MFSSFCAFFVDSISTLRSRTVFTHFLPLFVFSLMDISLWIDSFSLLYKNLSMFMKVILGSFSSTPPMLQFSGPTSMRLLGSMGMHFPGW